MIRRILVIALTWDVVWSLFALCFGVVLGVMDPESIAPGEAADALLILGSMGALSGLAFASLSSLGRWGATPSDLSFVRAVANGVLGTAIVQIAYLNHGDAGLLANVKMALVFCAFGGVITAAWVAAVRWWPGSLRPH